MGSATKGWLCGARTASTDLAGPLRNDDDDSESQGCDGNEDSELDDLCVALVVFCAWFLDHFVTASMASCRASCTRNDMKSEMLGSDSGFAEQGKFLDRRKRILRS